MHTRRFGLRSARVNPSAPLSDDTSRGAVAQASRLERVDEGAYAWRVPDGWQQGRGAFGGLVIAALARAALATERDPARRLRSLTAELCGPAQVGDARIVVEWLRRGSKLSNLEARLLQSGEVVARAGFVLAEARRAVELPALEPPQALGAGWEALEPVPLGPPLGPVFSQHYAYRLTAHPPFAGAREASAEGWVSASGGGALDVPAVLALLDVWWPAHFATLEAPRPSATVSFTAQLLVDPSELAAEPLYHRARAVASSGGYLVELRELWARDGRLVALNQQTFAVLG